MEKRHALFVSFMITFVVVGNFLFFYDFSEGREKVIIARVIDGDTLELEDGRTIRLLNINTPEKKDFYYEDAKNFLAQFENKSVELETQGVDKYRRVLGRIYSPEYINLEIVENGFAHPYLVEETELKKFKGVEKRAFEKQIGIWERSEYYGCLNVEINKYDEYVRIIESCDVNLKGWTIKDESRKKYSFENSLRGTITLYSENGEDEYDKLYWGAGNIWNNDKDSIFIRDSEGKLVYYDSYGY